MNFKADWIRRVLAGGALAAALIVAAGACGMANAGLGDTITNAGAGAGTTVREAQGAYTMVEGTDPASGDMVDQYIATAGNQVFLVTWSGPHQPDLQSLLSTYFGAYASALAQQTRQKMHSLHVAHIDTGSLVVEMTGHPGDFRGAAYVRELVPAGVDVATLIR